MPRGGGGTQEWNQEESGSGHFREVAFVGSQLKSSDREMVGLLPAFVHGGRDLSHLLHPEGTVSLQVRENECVWLVSLP